MSWVLTSERKPTADDADERNRVWVMWRGKLEETPLGRVELLGMEVWHPKPKAVKPEPYKPPVPEPEPERVEVWSFIDPSDGLICGQFDSREAAEQSSGTSNGWAIKHFREVRDGDPSPEDVAAVREQMQCGSYPLWDRDRVTVSSDVLRRWFELLGGKP